MPIPKSRLSSDCTLQLGCMKVESLVIADQHAAVNTFPGLVHTARHTMGVGSTLSGCGNRKGLGHHGRVSDWGEVVTREREGNLRLDRFLSSIFAGVRGFGLSAGGSLQHTDPFLMVFPGREARRISMSVRLPLPPPGGSAR